MKKLLIFALLLVPMTTYAASSVRVLGAKSATTNAGTTTTTTSGTSNLSKAATAAKSGATSSNAGSARIGTISSRAKKIAAATGTNSVTTSSSRFPVITPAHSYKTVTPPQPGTEGGGVNPGCCDVDVNAIVDAVTQRIPDDPRVDMIRTFPASQAGQAEAIMTQYWQNNPRYAGFRQDGWVFMWVEE